MIADLIHDDPRVRAMARLRLIEAGQVEPLLQALSTATPELHREIVSVLGRLENERCVPPLIEALHSDDTLLMAMAAEALHHYRQPMVVEALLAVLPTSALVVQSSIVHTLEKLGNPAAVLPLMDTLRRATSNEIRYTIIQALGVLGDPQAIDLITTFLDHENHHVQKRAQIALERLKGM